MKINPLTRVLTFMMSMNAITSIAFANEQCAELSFLTDSSGKEGYVLELAGSNGLSVVMSDTKKNGYKQIAKGEYHYLVEAGEHTVVLNRWKKEEYLSYKKSLQRGRQVSNPPVPSVKLFHIDVRPDMHYRLGYSDDKGAYIESEKKLALTCDNDSLITANKSERVLVKDSLPNALEVQLNSTISKLASYNDAVATNVFNIKEYKYFGIVFSQAAKTSGLEVKSILPHSFASKLGVNAGDIITALGNNEITERSKNPYEILNNYVASVDYNDELSLTILRNGQAHKLTKQYVPVLVPESFYHLSKNEETQLYGQNALPKHVQFELDQLLLALSQHFKEVATTKDKLIVIERVVASNGNAKFSLAIDLANLEMLEQYLLTLKGSNKMQDALSRMVAERMGAITYSRNQYTNKNG